MSRERVRKRIPNFLKGWDREKSRRAGDAAYIHGEQFGPFDGTEIDGNVEIGTRNRSGERRRTGRRMKDVG